MSTRARTAVLTGISVAILLFAFVFGWKRFHSETLSDSDLWLRHPDGYTVLSDTDYQVLSSFLKGRQTDIRIGSARGSSIVAPVTTVFLAPMPSEEQRWMKRELKGLQDDTLSAFHRCMPHSAVIAQRFSVPEPYQIGTFAEVENIELLYAHHPKTNGFVQFSCVAYSRVRPQALFWVERRMTHSAVGLFVLMEKDAHGEWGVTGEMIRWIA